MLCFYLFMYFFFLYFSWTVSTHLSLSSLSLSSAVSHLLITIKWTFPQLCLIYWRDHQRKSPFLMWWFLFLVFPFDFFHIVLIFPKILHLLIHIVHLSTRLFNILIIVILSSSFESSNSGSFWIWFCWLLYLLTVGYFVLLFFGMSCNF